MEMPPFKIEQSAVLTENTRLVYEHGLYQAWRQTAIRRKTGTSVTAIKRLLQHTEDPQSHETAFLFTAREAFTFDPIAQFLIIGLQLLDLQTGRTTPGSDCMIASIDTVMNARPEHGFRFKAVSLAVGRLSTQAEHGIWQCRDPQSGPHFEAYSERLGTVITW